MSKVYFGNRKVGDFKYPIRCLLDLTNKYIVLLEVPSNEMYSENVFCINKEGKLLWQIEKKKMPHSFSSYYGLDYNKNALLVYSSSIERLVDLNSGKILETDIVK